MRGLRKLSNFEAITQGETTEGGNPDFKTDGEEHRSSSHTRGKERKIDLLLDRRYKGSAGNRTLSRKGFSRRVSVSYESSG